MNQFRGTGVALITPFNEDKSVDFNGLENLVNHCIEEGVNYLVVMGTTGESATLTTTEKKEVLSFIQKINAGKLPIVYGIGGNSTMTVVDTIKSTDFSGIDAILSVSPYYNKPTQEGIYQHYKTISENSPVPIILYNVPGRTASNISADTTLRLANNFDNIIAVKEASGDLEQIMKIINERPEGFLMISGDDNLTLPMIALGGDGVISVSGQAFPSVFTKMVSSGLEGNISDSRKGHYQLFEITKMLFKEGNPGGIKYALQNKGVISSSTVRQPLWPISKGLEQEMDTEIKNSSL